MAEEVRQIIGIDVTQAIAAVDQLEQKLAGFGNKLSNLAGQLTTFNSTAKQALNFGNVNKSLGETTRILDQFGNPIKNLTDAANAADKLGGAAKSAGDAIRSGFGAKISTSLQNVANRFGTVGQSIFTLGSRGVASIKTTGSAIVSFGNRSAAALTKLTGGFSLLTRVFTTQLLVRSIAGIQRAFRQAIGDAVDFQRSIAEITTITEGSFSAFDTAADSVRRLSDEFNADLGEVGEGLYQVISNQIKGAAVQTDVLTESLRLSRAGISDVGAAVELLTGTINAFQLAQTDADRISAVFFKTVELGRTRIRELANSFGSVAPLAGEAGVEFEELAAAFSTLTINGINTAKSATQLRGIVNALIKPTNALKEVFEEAGFASGSVAVKSLGFVGVLQLLQSVTGGSSEEMAKLIPRIRGLAGAQILARDGAATLAANLTKTREAARDLAAEKLAIIFETPAEQVTKELNQIKNALTVDFGQEILKVAAAFLKLTGAGDRLVVAIKTLTPVIIATIGALVAYGAVIGTIAVLNLQAVQTFRLLFTAANTSIGGFLGAIGLLAVAGVALAFAINAGANAAAEASGRDAIERAKKSTAQQLNEARKARAKLLAEEKEGIRERARELQKSLAGVRSALAARTKIFKEENAKILKDTKAVFKAIQDANSDLLSNLSSERQQANDAAIAGEQRIGDARANLSDLQFGFGNERFNQIQQTTRLEERASQLGRQAAQELGKAQSEAQIQAAQATAQRAQGFQQEALALAQQTGNRVLVNRLQQSSVSLAKQLIRAEQVQVALQKRRAAELQKIAGREKQRISDLNSAIELATDLQTQLKIGGDVVDRTAIAKQLRGALSEISRLSVPEGDKLSTQDIFAIQQFRKDIIDSLTQVEARGINIKNILSGAAITDFEARFEAAVVKATRTGLRKALAAGIPIADIQAALLVTGTDQPFAGIDTLVNSINDLTTKQLSIADNAEKLRQAAEDIKQAALTQLSVQNRQIGFLENLRGTTNALTGRIAEAVEIAVAGITLGGVTATTATVAAPQLQAFSDELTQLPQQVAGLTTTAANATLQGFNKRFQEFQSTLGASAKLVLQRQLTTVSIQIQTLDKFFQDQAGKGVLTAEQIRQQLDGVKDVGSAAELSLKNSAVSTQAMATASQTFATQLAAAATSSATLNTNLQNAASVQLGGAVGGQTGRFFPRFLAGGGFSPKGTDTIPAMLSPGEFVVNARSTKRFFSQLQAINAGVKPLFRQEGGAVTNVGDINVTVSGGRDGSGTGRSIARSIRRELRRGTSSL